MKIRQHRIVRGRSHRKYSTQFSGAADGDTKIHTEKGLADTAALQRLLACAYPELVRTQR